ncbi:E3 ubiquitin-protein ligase PUB23-like [Chenopodium quinoa]|uniref:E3 ubiquitin-protein ligase PUB23-like n=1 Tax=Chenopodium quinoa TaxID=63459 RepID=UPI000B776847|nr:E3 ubiquitin-protein ligase PUB23-like [Chenopodium quinoa]
MDHNEEIDVPSFFICPISLQIMKDPITVPTGITYDRESIEKWVFTNNNTTCPVTKQPLNIDSCDCFLTPNHTLRRLAQSWCTLNASYGVERFPTPKPPVTKTQVLKLIDDASNSSAHRLVNNLDKLKSIAFGSSANKRCLETTPGVAEFLVRLIVVSESDEDNKYSTYNSVSDEALRILSHLQISDEMVLKKVLKENDGLLVDSLVRIMQKNSYESRSYAIGLMKQLVQVAEPTQLVAFSRKHFVQVVELIKDDVSPKATKAALKVLALACPWGRNRIRVVEAGAVPVMIEFLLLCNERRNIEMVLAVLDQLSGCAEGRAELLGHAAGLAVVSKKILRVSHFATERGIKILYAISKFSGTPSVVQEMVQLGVVTKLCLVLQVDCEAKTKEKAREILKTHAKAWKNSPCAPSHVFGSLN